MATTIGLPPLLIPAPVDSPAPAATPRSPAAAAGGLLSPLSPAVIASPSPVSPDSNSVAVLHEALMELLAARHLFRAALAAQQERDDAAASAASAA